jgi:hypothetical protein
MENLYPFTFTSPFIKITGSPHYLSETGRDTFRLVQEYASTNTYQGFVKGDLELYLGEDIEEIHDSGRFRLNFLLSEYPGNLIESLRDYAQLRGYDYVSMDLSKQSWNFKNDSEIIEVTPRLFVPILDEIDDSLSRAVPIFDTLYSRETPIVPALSM